jgi:hypothetical protein
MAEAVINAGKVLSEVTIEARVTGWPVAKARWWVGVQVMKLAVLIMGCKIEIEAEFSLKTEGFGG